MKTHDMMFVIYRPGPGGLWIEYCLALVRICRQRFGNWFALSAEIHARSDVLMIDDMDEVMRMYHKREHGQPRRDGKVAMKLNTACYDLVRDISAFTSVCCLLLKFSKTTESRNGSDVTLESKTVTGSRMLALYSPRK